MLKKLLLVTVLIPCISVADMSKAPGGMHTFDKSKLKQDFQEAKQKVKEAEQKYHKSVQDTEDAKKNNLPKDEIARREHAQEQAKQELEAAKK